MKRIFGWNDASLCYWYRLKTPFEALARTGEWEVSWGRALPADIHTYDVVVGQRLVGLNEKWLEICRNPNILAVYEMDDDLLNFGTEHRWGYEYYKAYAEGTARSVAAADVVTVCTPYVAENTRKVNSNVHLLPVCISAAVLEMPPLAHEGLVVGWAGMPFHEHDWTEVPEQLEEFARRVPRASFHTMGADYLRDAFAGRKRVTDFQPYADYYASIDFDVGIAPLKKTDFNRGKSHTKPLEYGARGVPVVATAWGQYVDWIKHGVNGFLVEKPADWLDCLMAISDEKTLEAMSTQARESAREYTIERQLPLWERAYSGE